jgi:8-oxo-dGTP pyrophosphatase MutT (NUDIX family)
MLYAFEDQYDFPRGRGKTFKQALREVEEETGYRIQPDIIFDKKENYSDIIYTGLDSKQYRIVFHVVFLSKSPTKKGRGEIQAFKYKWYPLQDALSLADNLKDNRNKFSKYFDILKNLLDYCVEHKI